MAKSEPPKATDAPRLELSEALWQAVLRTAQDAIICIDGASRITLFNTSAERIFGYRADEVAGRSVALLMPAPYSEQHAQYIQRYRDTGVAQAIGRIRDVQARRKDGTVFPIELSVSEVRSGDEVIYSAIIRDLSGRKATEDALRQSEDRFIQFMQHLPGAAFMKDLEGRYVYVNESFERLSDRELPASVGRFDHEVWPAAFAKRLRDSDQRVIRSRTPLQTTESFPHADGLHYWLVTKFPIFNADGTPSMVGGVAIDITERRRAEEALREMQKLDQQRARLADIGAISAQIVHDLGNPLAGVSMQAQLILRRALRDENQPVRTIIKPVEHVLAEVRRLDSLIKEFMEFSREQRLDVKPIDLRRFLQDIIDLWQPVARARATVLELDVAEGLPELGGDEEKLRRVFDNLVKNAVEAIDQEPAWIRIRATALAPETVRISVEDSGVGIPETLQVFRLFETTKAHGSGLGLAIVRQIVLAHGGGIQFEPGEQRGTVFHVDLPLRAPAG